MEKQLPTKPKFYRLIEALLSIGKQVVAILKLLFNKLLLINRQWNEAWLLVAGYFALHYVPVFLPEPMHRFFYASLGTVAAHFMVSLMLRLSQPLVFKYLYGLFQNDLFEKNDAQAKSILQEKKHSRMKYSMLIVFMYLVTWLVLVVSC